MSWSEKVYCFSIENRLIIFNHDGRHDNARDIWMLGLKYSKQLRMFKNQNRILKCANVFLVDHHDCDIICLYFYMHIWVLKNHVNITWLGKWNYRSTFIEFKVNVYVEVNVSFCVRVAWRTIHWKFIYCHPLWIHTRLSI